MKPLDLTGLEDGPQAAGLNLEALDEPTSNKVGDGVAAAASGQFVPARFAAAVNPETPYPGVDRFGSQIGPARSLGTLGEAGRMLRESLPATMVLGRSENQRLQDLQAQGSAGLNPPALDYRGQRTDQAGNLLPSVAKPVEVTEDTGALPSLARGVVGLGKIGVGLGLQAQDIAGIKGGPLPGWAADLKAITDEMQPEVGEFKNIGRGFTADERGALARRGAAYLQEAVMENLPMMVPSLVSGALALVFGRNLIKAAAARAMEAAAADSAAREALNHAARNLGVQAAEKHFIKAAGKAAAERATLAAQVAGATAGSVALESGNIYADMAEEGHRGRTQALVAAGAAVPAGVLDTLGEVMALRRLQGAPLGSAVARLAEKALGKPMVERGVVKLGVAGVEQFIAEAPTEFLQEAIEQAAKVSQDPAAQGAFWSKWWDTAPQWREAGIKGGLGGLGIGVGSGAIGAVVTGRGGESSKVKDQQSMVAVETEAPAVEGVDYLPDAGGVDPVEELVGEAQSSKLKAQTEIVPGPDYQPMEGQPFETDEPLPLPPQPAEGERQKAKGKSEVVPGPDYQPLEGQPFETDEPLPPVTEPSPPVVVPGVVPGTGLDLSGLEPDEWALDYGDGGTLPEVQPWPKLPEPPKAGNRENKNIGRTWNSRFGKQTIVGVESVPAGDYYDVRDESGAVRVYPGGQLEDRIKRDEYEMTPEYAQERAAAEQKRKTDAERAAKVEAQEAKNRTELSQFTANDNPMVAGKKHAALLRVFSFDGVPMTVKAKVEELVLAGERANVTEEPALKEMTRAQFNRATEAEQKEHDRRRKAAGNKSVYRVGGYDVGKTAFEYARYLEGMLPKSASGTLETAVPPVAPAATPGGVTTAPEPSYISPKEIQERFAAESERAAAKQSETVAKMGAEEEAWRNRPRKQTGEELQKEWEAQQNAKKLAKEAAPAPPAVAAEVRKPEVVKEKQAVAPLAAKAQKKFLLEEIDKALAEAPDVEVTPYPVQGNETSERRDELKKQYAAALAADKARVGTVTIEVPGDGAFEILNTRKALQAFKAKAAKFPTTVPKKAEPGKVRETPTAAPVVGKMEPGAALKAARMVVSEDTEREVINHVWSDGQQSVATDGARMMIVQAGNGGTAKAPVLVREDGKTEPAKNRGKDAKGNKKGDFPDWRAVVPKESIERGNGLDTGRLWTVLKQALAVWIGHKETQHSVTLVRNKDGSIGLMTSAPEAGYYVHNVQPGWQSIVAVNGEYLADGLAAARMVGNEKVAISWTDEMAPVVIDGKGFKYVVMPMRLNGGRIEEVAKQEAERVAKMEELAGAARGEGKRQKAKGKSEEGASATGTDKLIAKMEGMKSAKHRGEVGAFNLPGISEAMWNTALDAGIGLLKAGRAIGEAIDAVVAKLRELGADFDEANVRQAVADGLGIGFRGVHKAPDGTHGEASLDAINRTYPDDIYSPDGARFYGDGISARRDAAMHRMIVAAKGNPAAKVTVYRSVPKGQAGEILPGDWVTPSREYAADHGARFAGGMTILKREVRAGDLFTEGNSIYEFGWSPKGAGVAEFIAKLEGMKSSKHRGEVGAFNLPGVTEAVWNTALDAGIQLLKLGRSIGEAIDAVVAKLRELGADFDEANVRQAVAIQLGEEPLREHAIKQLHAGNRNAAVQAAILAASTRDVRSDDEVDAAVAGIIREAGGAEAALPVVNDVRLPLDTRYALALAVANQLNDEVMRLTGQQPAGWLAESNRLAQLVGKFLGEFIPTTTETARGLRQLARLKAMGRQTPIGWDTFARTTIENVNAEQRARLAPTLQSLIEELNRLNAEVARATAETKAVQDAARQAAEAAVRAEAERQGSEIRNAMVIETTNGIELLPSVRKAKAAATVKALQKIGGAGYWQGLVNKGQAALVKAIEQALNGAGARVNAVTVAEIAQLMTRVLRQQVDATLGTAAQKRQGLPALMKLRVLFGANERMSDFWRGVRGQLANELTEKYGERPEIEALLAQTMDVWSGPLVRAAMKEVLAEQETNLGAVIREHLRGVGTGSIEAARATLAAKIVEAVGLDEQTGERLARAVEAEFDAEMRKQQGKVAERLRKAEENRRKAAAAVPRRRAEAIVRQFAKSQSDTLSWMGPKVTDAIREAVTEQVRDGALTDEAFAAKLEGLGVPADVAETLAATTQRERTIRQAIEAEDARQTEAEAPTKRAGQIVRKFAVSQSDTLAWSQQTEDVVGAAVQRQLAADVGKGQPVATEAEFAAELEGLGVKPDGAATLAAVVMRERTVREATRKARAAEAQAKREAAAPTKAAERIVATLAKSQSDTQSWQKAKQGAVQRLVQHQISKRAWTDAVFRKLLERLGVKPAAAGTLTQVVAREIEVRNRLAQELMFGEDAIDKAIRKALTATGQQLGRIVRTHHSEQAGVGKALAERLVAEAGLSGPAAERLAAAVLGRFKQLAEQRKRRIVEQMTKPRTARELRKRSVADRIIEASNLGALDAETTWQALAEKLGLAVYTPEHSAEVRRRAELLQRLPVGSVQRIQATARLLAFIAKAHGVKASELAWAVWYANTLSGPMTHLVNSVSNLASLGSGTVAAMRGNPLALPRVFGALLHGFRVGGLEAGAVLRYGSEAKRAKFDTHQHALELLGPEAFTGARLVAGLKYVGRALAAADALFYFPAREVKTVQLAHALARGEGLRGAELARRRDEVMNGTDAQEADWRSQIGREAAGVEAAGMPADRLWRARRLQQLREENRPGAMVESADDFALKLTFNNQPTGLMGLVSGWATQATRQLPAARLVVPFINIVGNVVNESLNYTPWGFARGAAAGRNGVPSVLATFNEAARRGSVPVTPDAVIDLHAKAALGTLLFAGLALAAAAGGGGDDDGRRFQINGAGPRRSDGKLDAEKLKALKAAGWIPYSVRMGGRYYSFTSTPLSVPLAILGNYLDSARFNPREWEQTQALDRAVFALWSSASVFAQMSFIDSAARLMGWVHDGGRPKKMGDNLVEVVGRSAGSIVIPNALRQLDRMQDPTVYDGRGLAGAIAASVPFARRANEVALNAVGEPVAASPWARFASDAKPGIMQELAARGLWIAVPSADDVLPDLGRKLEPAEFHQYVKLSGEMIRKALAEDGQWRRLDAENAQRLVGEHVAESRHRARVLLGFEAPVDLPKAPKPYVPPVRLFGR